MTQQAAGARWLTAEELHRLTGKTRPSAQRRELDRRRIKYVPASSGEPLVRLDEAFDGSAVQAQSPRSGRPAGHRWDRIGGVRQLR